MRPPAALFDFGNSERELLEGVVERVTFHNDENGWSVLKLHPAGVPRNRLSEPVTVLGAFTAPTAGESLRCHGVWTSHPKHGRQFRCERYETLRPATTAAIEKYLGSGMVKGIGPKTAKALVAAFGAETLDVIEHEPNRLTEVRGIGESKATLIRSAWDEQRAVREIMVFLQGHGITPTYAVKIYKQYKERAIEVVEQNPYRLAVDIWGIGFKTADKIARNVGFAIDAPERLEAGVVYVLNQEMENGGHCYLPQPILVERAAGEDYLGVDPTGVESAVLALVERGLLVIEPASESDPEPAVYTTSIHVTETSLARQVHQRITSPWVSPLPDAKIASLLKTIPAAGLLSDEQRAAVNVALNSAISVLTGGPGTGKTTTTNVIVAAFEALHRRVQIASPTGRAAKRASEVTGREAKTIHRLLAWDPSTRGFKHDADNPLELDVLVVDESSMLDLVLAHSLIRAVPEGAQVVFVGDVDQLPSVGPGNVLSDLITSAKVPVARLTQVFRQAAASRIITGAHAINRGKIPELLPPSAIGDGADCVFLSVEESDDIPAKVAGVVAKSLPKLGYAADEITVLTPMQRGSAGARNLNETLQRVVNPESPAKPEIRRAGMVLRVGDRVLQRVNDYDKGVFNGDVGTVLGIDHEEQFVTVGYPEGPIDYEFSDLDQLTHAMALTVHKSQGSEYPAAVIVFHTQHYVMLQRNLLYTALTRAKKMAVLVGSSRAIAMAVRNKNTTPRWTKLARRLSGG